MPFGHRLLQEVVLVAQADEANGFIGSNETDYQRSCSSVHRDFNIH